MPTWLVPLILSPLIGSFLGLLIRRLPDGRPVALARSCCESCGNVLAPRDLIPIVSHLMLGGRCRFCHAGIAPFHLVIELAAIAVAATSLLASDDISYAWAGCVLGWALLALAWIDWKQLRLPDTITLPLTLCGLGATGCLATEQLADHAAAVALGYIAFRAIAIGYRRLRGREGLGEGDAKLLGAAGAWVGLAQLPRVVMGAALVGLTVAGMRWLGGHKLTATTPLPFGTSLAASLWIVWLWCTPP